MNGQIVGKNKLQIQLYGAFEIYDEQNKSFTPVKRKAAALVALLATSPRFKRSRSWLKTMLWGEFSEKRASASLRSCLYDLKKHFPSDRNYITSDQNSIWLNSDSFVVESRHDSSLEFLEGFDLSEEAFEDWLREVRFKSVEKEHNDNFASPLILSSAATSDYTVPGIFIYPVVSSQKRDQLDGDAIVDVFINSLSQQAFANIFDLRKVGQTDEEQNVGNCFGVVLKVTRVVNKRHFSIMVHDYGCGRVLWSHIIKDAFDLDSMVDERAIAYHALSVVNAVHTQLLACKYSNESSGSLIQAVHHVLSHSQDGQDKAKFALRNMAHSSGVARAWLIYTYAVAHAERYGGLGKESLEELEFHCIQAECDEPYNPLVQAIVGHIKAFVFRQMEDAYEHHKLARSLGSYQPLVWTLSAMHATYTNRPDVAYDYSSRAMVLSSHSPHSFYYEGPHSVSCTLTNRHREAIQLGQKILKRKPGFLAVMRHMSASQVYLGQIDDARNTIAAIRSKDEDFVSHELDAIDYPLPSKTSVRVIQAALNKVDLQRSFFEI